MLCSLQFEIPCTGLLLNSLQLLLWGLVSASIDKKFVQTLATQSLLRSSLIYEAVLSGLTYRYVCVYIRLLHMPL